MINLRNHALEELVKMLCDPGPDSPVNQNDILEELRERGYSREEIRQMEHNGLDVPEE